jgi:lysophospholipase L1-like esterase
MRSRGRIGALVVVLALAGGCSSGGAERSAASTTTTAAPATSTTAREPAVYLSIGDSYAAGFQPSDRGGATTTRGYADVLAARRQPVQLLNLGCAGATVTSATSTTGCALPAPAAPAYSTESQLDAAVRILREHRGDVAFVTVSLGGNDLLPCASSADPTTCVADAVTRVGQTLPALLRTVRDAAGPDVPIAGITYPDVLLSRTFGDPSQAESLAQLSVTAFQALFNPALRTAYESVKGIFVDVTAGTGAYGDPVAAKAAVCELTFACSRRDIHPTDAGYRRIADLLDAAIPHH